MPFQPLDPQTNLDPFTVVSFTGVDARTGFYLDADGVNSSLLVKTSDTPAMYVDAYQNVGINTLSPEAQLDVNAANGQCVKLTYNSTSNKGSLGVSSDGKLLLAASGGEVNVDSSNDFNVKSHNGTTAGLRLNNALVRASADQINYNVVTPGSASASKSIVLDSSKSISGITSLSADELTGTLQTAAQPNIESVTTLDVTGHNGVEGLALNGTLVTSSAEKLNYTDITTPGNAQASKALVVNADRDITLIRNLTATNLTGTLQTASQPNITSVGTLSSLNVSGAVTGLSRLSLDTTEVGRTLVINSEDGNNVRMYYDADTSTDNYTDLLVSASGDLSITASGGNVDIVGHDGTQGLKLDGTLVTASADELNYIAAVNVGQAVGGKALVVDSNRSISNLNNVSATNLTGTLQTAAQPNVTSVNVLNVANHNGSTTGLALNNVLVTSTADELNYVDTTVGLAAENKAVILDSNKDFTGIHSITADQVTGELQTAAQPNITSVGTLTSITTSGDLTMGSTVISSTDIAKIDQISNGTASADKAVVLDSDKDITGINSLTANSLTATDITGTLQTSYQPNVTSVDVLDIAGHNGSTTGLRLDNELITSSAGQLNYTNVTPGAATANKAMVLDGSKSISGVSSLSADEITGELQTAAQPNVTSLGSLTSLDVTGDVTIGDKLTVTGDLECDGNLIVGGTIISESEIVHLDGATPGTAEALKAMITDSNNSISSVNNLGATTITLGSTVIDSTDIAKIDGITDGTAAANKALVLNGTLDISGINSLSATSLTGTLQTSYQPNVSSVDVLDITGHNGTTQGLRLGGELLTATASQLNSIFGGGSGGSANFEDATVTGDLDIINHDGSTQGLRLGGVLLTATANQLNSIFGGSGGSAEASFGDTTVNGVLSLAPSVSQTEYGSIGVKLAKDSSKINNISSGGYLWSYSPTLGIALAMSGYFNSSSRRINVITDHTGISSTSYTANSSQLVGSGIRGLCWNPNLSKFFIITANSSSSTQLNVASSTDGYTWTPLTLSGGNNLSSIDLGTTLEYHENSQTMIFFAGSSMYWSANGTTWTAVTNNGAAISRGNDDIYNKSTVCIANYATYIKSSNPANTGVFSWNGTTWTYTTTFNSNSAQLMVYNQYEDKLYLFTVRGANAGNSNNYYTISNVSTIAPTSWQSNISSLKTFYSPIAITWAAVCVHQQYGLIIAGMKTVNQFNTAALLQFKNETVVNVFSIGDIDSEYFGNIYYNSPVAFGNKIVYIPTSITTPHSNTTTVSSIYLDTITSYNTVSVNGISYKDYEVSRIGNVIDGYAKPNKALIVDGARSISNISSITTNALISTNIIGTIKTGYQPNITSLGTLTGLAVSGTISSTGVLTVSDTSESYGSTSGCVRLSGGLGVAKNIVTSGSLIVGGSISMSGVNITNTELAVIDNVTAGTATASKALVLDSSRNISNINSISSITNTLVSTYNNTFGTSSTVSSHTASGIAYSSTLGLYVSTINTSSSTNYYTSTDGTTWTLKTNLPNSRIWTDVVWMPNVSQFVMIGGAYSVYSSDGDTWTEVSLNIGNSSRLMYSPYYTRAIAYNPNSAEFAATLNGTTWTRYTTTSTVSNPFISIVEMNTELWFGTSISSNTITFETISGTFGNFGNSFPFSFSDTVQGAYAMAYSPLIDTYVVLAGHATNSNGMVRYRVGSSGGFSASLNLPVAGLWNYCVWVNEIKAFVAVSRDSTAKMIYSTNGINWFNVSGFTGSNSHTVLWSASQGKLYVANVGVNLNTITAARVVNVPAGLTIDSITITESELAPLDAVTPGTVAANKAVVVDSNKDISSFRNLTATNLTGTLQTVAQPNITSLGTLTTLDVTGATTLSSTLGVTGATTLDSTLGVTGTTTLSSTLGVTGATTLSSTLGVTGATTLSSTLDVSGDVTLESSIDVTGAAIFQDTVTISGDLECNGNLVVGGTIISESEIVHLDGATPGTAEALKAMITDSNNSISSINNLGATTVTLGSTVIDSTDIAKIDEITNGTAAANKALVLNGTLDVSGINSLSATSLTGTLQTSYQPNVTSVDVLDITEHDGATQGLRLGGELLTVTATQLNSIFGVGATGTFQDLTVTNDLDISNHNGTNKGLRLDGTLVTSNATELNYLDGSIPGAASASKALVLDEEADVTGINTLSATYIYGELQSSAQRNITTLSVLNLEDHNGSSTGLSLAGTLVTSTANELNYVDVTPGSATASKALVLDGNKDITGINSLSATQLTGQIQTATQPLITSVGTLTSVTTSGDLTLGSTVISETDIAKIDSIVNGTAAASKALVLDSSKNISGIHNLSTDAVRIGTPANTELNLEIGATNYNVNFAYAYNNESNAHGLVEASSDQTLAISARMDGRLIVTGETMIASDFRLKENIEKIDLELSKKFVMTTTPVTFNWKHKDSMLEYGYIAQEVYKAGFTDLVSSIPNVGLQSLVDEDGFESPADNQFVFTIGNIIPLLALNQKDIYKQLEEKDQQIAELEARLAAIEDMIRNKF